MGRVPAARALTPSLQLKFAALLLATTGHMQKQAHRLKYAKLGQEHSLDKMQKGISELSNMS
eukprot:1361598-Amphidinium_carterae.1